METTTPVAPTTAINLRRLTFLRSIALVGQALAIWVATGWFHMALPLQPLVTALSAVALINVATWYRLRRPAVVTDIELFGQLAFDLLALTALLYFSGGSTNPFVSLFLLPLTLAVVALPWAYARAMTALAIVCYSSLLFFYVPLPHAHAGHGEDFQLHVWGMWFGFVISAGLIGYFAVKMRETLRERDQLRIRMREQELRHERMLALGTLAAGAAHELGTPLSTMAVVVSDLERQPDKLSARVATLRAQIARCKEILGSLSGAASQTRAEGGGLQQLDVYLTSLIERWRAARSGIQPTCAFEGTSPIPHIVSEQTLTQALLNILNNAADASVESIEVDGFWNENELFIEVRDRGPGLSKNAEEHATEPFFTTKEPGEGMGLGLFLARGTIERLGGRVTLINRSGGGAACRVHLPLAPLRISMS